MKVPSNLQEAIEALKSVFPEEAFNTFVSKPNTNGLHHTLGRWIRNNWGLWSDSPLRDYFKDLGIFHPDDMSGIILKSAHRHYNNQDIDLDAQVKHYKDFWANKK